MPHVPRVSRTRASHKFRVRTTHGDDAYQVATVDQHQEVDRQVAADGVLHEHSITDRMISGAKLQVESIATEHIQIGAKVTNVENVGATVVIDDQGILINDGNLVIEDEFGQTTMDAGGFSGSWEDLILTGIKNGSFSDNLTASPATMGRTAHVPYWTLAQVTGTPTVSSAPGSVSTDFSVASDKVSFTSDLIRVAVGTPIYVAVQDSNYHASASVVTRVIKLLQYKSDGTLNSTTTMRTDTLTGGAGTTAQSKTYMTPAILPAGAGFSHGSATVSHVKVVVEVTATTLSGGLARYSCREVSLLKGGFVGFEATGQGNTNCTTSVQTSLSAALTGMTDVAGFSIGSGAVSVPTGYGGRYRITFTVTFGSGAGTLRRQVLRINSSDVAVFTYGANATVGYMMTATWEGDLVDADTVDFEAMQNSGGTLTAALRYLIIERLR